MAIGSWCCEGREGWGLSRGDHCWGEERIGGGSSSHLQVESLRRLFVVLGVAKWYVGIEWSMRDTVDCGD